MGAFYLGFDFCENYNTLTSLCTGTHRLESYCVEENATRWDCVRRRRLLGWKFPAFVFKYARPVAPHGVAVTLRQTPLKARHSQEKVFFVFFSLRLRHEHKAAFLSQRFDPLQLFKSGRVSGEVTPAKFSPPDHCWCCSQLLIRWCLCYFFWLHKPPYG